MGQYHIVVDLSKREWLNPHRLGCGLKLLEQLDTVGGTPTALFILLACSNGRGGGDFPDGAHWEVKEKKSVLTIDKPQIADLAKKFIGRWAGDRIAVVGDYAEDGDLQPQDEASTIYKKCFNKCNGEEFKDITDEMLPLVAYICEVEYEGDGWRDVKKIGGGKIPSKVLSRYGSSNTRKRG